MTDMTRTLKMIADCDDEVHFERKVKRELLRLHDLLGKANALARIRATRIEELESQLYAVGAGGVSGPVITEPAKPVTLHLTMCADQHCGNYATCYRAQAKPAPDQPFFALSPREGGMCQLYTPMLHTDGASALREDAPW